jgi:hypothetical protein
VLLAVTWKLWIPQADFPQVPLFRWAGSIPTWIEWSCTVLLLAGLLRIAVGRREAVTQVTLRERVAWLVVAGAFLLLVLIDQHRLQTWAYQLGLMSFVFAFPSSQTTPLTQVVRRVDSLALLRWLTVSIYFWSAFSKIDRAFVTSHGQTLVVAAFGAVGVDAARWPTDLKWWLAVALPLCELLVALSLAWPGTRRIGLWLAIALHGILLAALGPLGLNHSRGVLTWNLAFIVHDWLLFRREPCAMDSKSSSPFFAATCGLILFACAWPALEPFGGCDHWLAWSVYSTRTERVTVTLTEAGVRRLPEPARRLVQDGELAFDRWSFDALAVPVYPQLRFQLGLVEATRRMCGEDNLLEITVVVPSGRNSTESISQRLDAHALDERLEQFWFNARSRN